MERTSTASIKAALCLAAALFALNVYRAATADITPAEAWNYTRYVLPTWQQSLSHYDANNHVLNTFLVRISTGLLGRKEIALRLPSLLAGLLYCWAVWRLARRLFGGWSFAAAVALLILNPLVVDALSSARGYGMAMAFWLLGLECFLQAKEKLAPGKLNRAAGALALSVAASLSFIVPALALAITATALLRRRMGRDFWLPWLVFLFVLLALPLNRALLSDFALGATSLRQTLAEVTAPSLSLLPFAANLTAGVVRVAAAVMLGCGVIYAVFRRDEPLLLLCASTGLIGMILLLCAHAWIKTPFPREGAIYFVPILSLLGLALLRRRPRAALLLVLPCILIYAAELPVGPYLAARSFAGSRSVAKALRSEAGTRIVRVAVSPALEGVLDYYRARYRQANWQTIDANPAEPGYDYYVLCATDAPLLERLHLRRLDRTPGILLAAPIAR